MMVISKVTDIRKEFIRLFKSKQFAENDTLEIVNASFIADEESIFGKLNIQYAESEVEWYMSQSLNIDDIPCDIPKIWEQIASTDRKINSNYGWCILSSNNSNQFDSCMKTLESDLYSRQAVMIYIRPTMHEDAFKNGMQDFICTFAVQILVRDNKLHYLVFMRSNDAIFGYKNDVYWHNEVHETCMVRLNRMYPELEKGNMYWNVGSLHIYPRHYKLLENL